jgi:hypothetical protein
MLDLLIFLLVSRLPPPACLVRNFPFPSRFPRASSSAHPNLCYPPQSLYVPLVCYNAPSPTFVVAKLAFALPAHATCLCFSVFQRLQRVLPEARAPLLCYTSPSVLLALSFSHSLSLWVVLLSCFPCLGLPLSRSSSARAVDSHLQSLITYRIPLRCSQWVCRVKNLIVISNQMLDLTPSPQDDANEDADDDADEDDEANI